MTHEKFKVFLINSFRQTNEGALKLLAGTDHNLKLQADVELKVFLDTLSNKSYKIFAYMQNGDSKKPLKIWRKMPNFIFTFTINTDKTSTFQVDLIKGYKRTYDADFLKYRIKPLSKQGYVYFIQSEYGFKIGQTKRIDDRLNLFTVKLPFKFTLHSFVRTSRFIEIESILHKNLDHKRLNGEWFQLTDDDFAEIDIILSNLYAKREFEL